MSGKRRENLASFLKGKRRIVDDEILDVDPKSLRLAREIKCKARDISQWHDETTNALALEICQQNFELTCLHPAATSGSEAREIVPFDQNPIKLRMQNTVKRSRPIRKPKPRNTQELLIAAPIEAFHPYPRSPNA